MKERRKAGLCLSPLLANVLLEEVDKELEKRGLSFVRYAGDLNVYVGSRRAGEDAMQMLTCLYAGLRLRINEAKSAVGKPWDRKFLGYSFWMAPGRNVKWRVAAKALEAMKAQIREITSRNRGRSMKTVFAELRSYLLGWKAYFQLADTPRIFAELDERIRHRLRAQQLKQWKRGSTVYRELRALGMPHLLSAKVAAGTRRWWWNASKYLNIALPSSYYDKAGLPRLTP